MRPETPEHKGLAIGGYEEKRRKLLEERKKEYNDMLAKVRGHHSLLIHVSVLL